MVAITDPVKNRLTIETNKIASATMAIRSLDWDRDRFDIKEKKLLWWIHPMESFANCT